MKSQRYEFENHHLWKELLDVFSCRQIGGRHLRHQLCQLGGHWKAMVQINVAMEYEWERCSQERFYICNVTSQNCD